MKGTTVGWCENLWKRKFMCTGDWRVEQKFLCTLECEAGLCDVTIYDFAIVQGSFFLPVTFYVVWINCHVGVCDRMCGKTLVRSSGWSKFVPAGQSCSYHCMLIFAIGYISGPLVVFVDMASKHPAMPSPNPEQALKQNLSDIRNEVRNVIMCWCWWWSICMVGSAMKLKLE